MSGTGVTKMTTSSFAKKKKKKPRAQHHNRSMHPSERSMDVNRSMPPATGACTTRHVQEKK
jgi:hypothetical protein